MLGVQLGCRLHHPIVISFEAPSRSAPENGPRRWFGSSVWSNSAFALDGWILYGSLKLESSWFAARIVGVVYRSDHGPFVFSWRGGRSTKIDWFKGFQSISHVETISEWCSQPKAPHYFLSLDVVLVDGLKTTAALDLQYCNQGVFKNVQTMCLGTVLRRSWSFGRFGGEVSSIGSSVHFPVQMFFFAETINKKTYQLGRRY